MTEVTIVNFDYDAENQLAIYIGNDLFKYGDQYHDAINPWTRGFVNGLNMSNLVNKHFQIYVFQIPTREDEYVDSIPETLEECRNKFSKDWEQVSVETWE